MDRKELHFMILLFGLHSILMAEVQMVSRTEAVEQCSKQGTDWGLVDGSTNKTGLIKEMQRQHLNNVWLSVVKHSMNHWYWINGSRHNDTIFDDPGSVCGGLSVQRKTFQAINCGESGNGFICQMPVGIPCPEENIAYSCTQIGGIWFHFGCPSYNYYKAREKCLKAGGDLATFPRRDDLSVAMAFILERKLYNHCSWLFVGLRKEEWVTQFRNTSHLLRESHWAAQEPRSGKGDCAILELKGNDLQWLTTPCHVSKAHVLCQSYANETLKTPYSSSNNQQSSTENKTVGPNVLLVVVCIIGAIIMCFAMAVMTRWIMHHRKEKQQKRYSPGEHSLPLLGKKTKEYNGITVIIFSAGIDVKSEGLEKVKIFQNNLGPMRNTKRGTSLARYISRAFDRVGLPRENETFLRIVNISTVYSDGKLSHELASDLVKKMSKIDEYGSNILYLPAPEVPATRESLGHLWELRKKCVTIAAATRYSNELTAAECIAVGITNRIDEMLTSGVLDFSLAESECQGCHGLEEGVATAVGMVAGLMYKLKSKEYNHSNKTQWMRNILLELLTDKSARQHTRDGFGILKLENINQIDDDKLSSLVTAATKKNMVVDHTSLPSENVKNAVLQNLGQPDDPIRIVIGATKIAPPESLQSIITKHGDRAELQATDDIATNAIRECLNQLSPNGGDVNFMKLYEDPIYPDEGIIDWPNWKKDLDEYVDPSEEKVMPHIMFLAATHMNPQVGMLIQRTIRKLKDNFVIITNAIGTKGPVAPTSLPSDSVIAVCHSAEVACGSTVDIFEPDHGVTGDDTAKSWASAMKVVAIAAVVLQRARNLGIVGEQFKALCKTTVMRNILREMCTHPNEHRLEDAFGQLEPWNILHSDEQLKQIIMHYTNKEVVTDFWSGKTI